MPWDIIQLSKSGGKIHLYVATGKKQALISRDIRLSGKFYPSSNNWTALKTVHLPQNNKSVSELCLWNASFGCVNESEWTCFYSCSSSLCPANTESPPPWILEGWVHPPSCPPASAFPLASPAMGPAHRGMERDSHALWRPHFLLLFSDLPAWHNKNVMYLHN